MSKLSRGPVLDANETDVVQVLADTARGGEEPTLEELRAVLAALRTWLARRGLSREDLEEVSSEAVYRLIRIARAQDLDPARPAGAWLRVVADRLAFDVLRRRGGRAPVPFDESWQALGVDDEMGGALSRIASRADVDRLLAASAADGEHDVVKVMAAWLALTAANGKEATSREIGARLGISHVQAQRLKRRFEERARRA